MQYREKLFGDKTKNYKRMSLEKKNVCSHIRRTCCRPRINLHCNYRGGTYLKKKRSQRYRAYSTICWAALSRFGAAFHYFPSRYRGSSLPSVQDTISMSAVEPVDRARVRSRNRARSTIDRKYRYRSRSDDRVGAGHDLALELSVPRDIRCLANLSD